MEDDADRGRKMPTNCFKLKVIVGQAAEFTPQETRSTRNQRTKENEG